MKRPLIVAHRGYPSKAIENTIESFRIAFESGADFVEGDFWLSSDREIVCIHDENLLRVTNKTNSLNITNSNLSSIKSVDFFSEKFNQRLVIPTLEEVLEIIPPEKGLFIELKDHRLELVDVLILKLKKINFKSERLRIISFYPSSLKYSKSVLPEIKTHLLFDWLLVKEKCKNKIVFHRFLHLLNEIHCDGININYSPNINEEFVRRIKDAGFEIGVYDANDENSLLKTIGLDVDFITTDYPDLALKILTEVRKINLST
jgi:glycerophosphoryl diester phosphodiesterase